MPRILTNNKTFNRKAECIFHGNAVTDTQYSTYVRPYSETECNGFINPKGHLQKFDLKTAREKLGLPSGAAYSIKTIVNDNGGGCLYCFFHWNGSRRIIHGWILTAKGHGGYDKNMKPLYRLGCHNKSRLVLDPIWEHFRKTCDGVLRTG